MTTALMAISKRLATATSLVQIFGSLPLGDSTAAAKVLKQQYRYLIKQVHPDQVQKSDVVLAGEVMELVVSSYERAKKALAAGTYEHAFTALGTTTSASAPATMVIAGRHGRYTLQAQALADGDFSVIYKGKDEQGKPVFAKVAADPTFNSYLAHEAKVLTQGLGKRGADGLRPYLPELLDSILLREAKNEQFHVNVFRYKPDYVSLTQIRTAYPRGVPIEVAAWIWRRVIAQTLAANMMGVVHGAMIPDHVLVHPVTHEPLHLGWAHSVTDASRGGRITTVIDRFRDWYPPEVWKREVPTHQTDLYMAGKMFIYLLGGDLSTNVTSVAIPPSIERLVRQCLEANPDRRPRDGHALLREFTGEVHRLWGKVYRPLSMPT
jgi:hypothetical protein